MKLILKFCFSALFLMFAKNALADAQAIMIAGDLINKTSIYWNGYGRSDAGKLLFAYNSGFFPVIRTSLLEPNSNGRFVFALPIGAHSVIDINWDSTTIPSPFTLCSFSITVIDAAHVKMQMISNPPNPYFSCAYSGNPIDETAVITVSSYKKVLK